MNSGLVDYPIGGFFFMSPTLLREEIQELRNKWQGQENPQLYRELSDLLFTVGKIPAAMNLIENSFAIKVEPKVFLPEDGKRWFHQGLEYADACLYEEACACLNRAIQTGLETFETFFCLAGVEKSLGRLEEAEIHCRKSLEYNPQFSPAFILLGSIAKLEGCLTKSIEAIQNALFIDPDFAPAHYDLACYLALSGELERALSVLDTALCKGFCDFEWMNRDPDLAPLRALPEFASFLREQPLKRS